MALPSFYSRDLSDVGNVQFLDEETSKHLAQVLRKQAGDEVLLTNGKGTRARAAITEANRRKTGVRIISVQSEKEHPKKVSIAISLIKNTSRYEWFLEKATEIGVYEIIPLLCQRTEKNSVRFDRMRNIIVSAMLQSNQCWLPQLLQPQPFEKALHGTYQQKLIAHCTEDHKLPITSLLQNENHGQSSTSIILIGPEGDFTGHEIEAALGQDFTAVSLGNTRLRTETAGIVAASLLVNS